MEIISRNQMSGRELKAQHGAIEFVENPKTNKLFFACGTLRGYVSPKVQEAVTKGNLTIDQINYAQCSTDGGDNWVDCIMMKSTNNVKMTL